MLKRILWFVIKTYQYLISPLMKPCCRYYPSCSEYAQDAIECHGIAKGFWRAIKRIMRCHPWSSGGYDPVVPNDETH